MFRDVIGLRLHYVLIKFKFYMSHIEIFNQHRSLLFSLAYRMLGTITDAEDIVQETYLRWIKISLEKVVSPKSYLSSITTRLCIDYLRSARVKREQYTGSWLPEPLITQQSESSDLVELADSLSMAFLVMLEYLSPTERAVFLLHEVFDYNYTEIAGIVDKNSVNCRQILNRARKHLKKSEPNKITIEQQKNIVDKFLQAWIIGDLQSLLALMTSDITWSSDGGGKVKAALKPLYGSIKVAKFLIAIRKNKFIPTLNSYICNINGNPGIINYTETKAQSVFSFDFKISDNKILIQNVFAVVNPEKLKYLPNTTQIQHKTR